MKKLPALAGSTPRSVKRYINIYRLLRARVPKDRLSQFLGNAGEPREYEAVMLLVGIYNVDAALARAVARALEEESTVEGVETIVLLSELLSRFKAKNTVDNAQMPFVDAFTDYCEEFEDTPKKPTIEPFCRWHPVVSRYSFCES